MLADFNIEPSVITLESAVAPLSRAPRTPEEAGLPFLFLVELTAKVLSIHGQMRLIDLSGHLKLATGVIDPLITFMRTEKLCEMIRRGGSGTDADLAYCLTDLGRAKASEFSSRCAYAGPAPVTLAAYSSQVTSQCVAQMSITRENISKVFSNIVVSHIVLEQVGAAMNSGRAMFIHGPAGSGKTYLAERLAGLLKGNISVPHAILVDGEVVQVYDAMVHKMADESSDLPSPFDKRMPFDHRWVRVKRPAIVTGGELTLETLDLQFDHNTRYYQAPPHLKANNGVFVIDDFGRQRCSAIDLMNRWIGPMDRQLDYLSLHTGHKFQVPFDVIVVFSSNQPPEQMGDSAFLRRLGYKIHIGSLTEPQYEHIFRQVCEQFSIPYSGEAFRYLLDELHYKEMRPLLACYPRDVLAQVRDQAKYLGKAPHLDTRVLDWAWNNYFVGA